jgi:transposase
MPDDPSQMEWPLNNPRREPVESRPRPRPTFQPYVPDQLVLPMDLQELIPPRHVVRVVNDAIGCIPDATFEAPYAGGGRPAYHPKMLTKVIVYAYTQRIYSSRQIAKAVREQVPFMWLAARQTPDFRTINRFRGDRLKTLIDQIVSEMLQQRLAAGYVKLEHYFVDGTKIEANANRYTFVWKKAVEKNKAKLEAKIRDLITQIDAVDTTEDAEYGDRDLDDGDPEPLDGAAVERIAAELEERLRTQPKTDKKARRVARELRLKLAPRLQRYEQQLAQCGERNSFSKTDPDATFMRLKEDHMRNGPLKPADNVQMGTENQFIIGYSVHQNRTDAGCLIPHWERLHTLVGRLPQTIVADAGYGSEENFAYVEQQGRTALMKWNTYRLEGTRKWQRHVKRAENWTYDDTRDEWICAAGQRLAFQGLKQARSDNGYRATLRVYQAHDCPTCPLKAEGTTAEYRRIQISPLRRRYKQEVRERLKVPEAMAMVKRRGVEVESVWGHIKEDRQFRRFLLRGLAKVQTEWGLLSVAHNLLKQATLAS